MQEVRRYLLAQDQPRQRVAVLEQRAAQAEEGHRQSTTLLMELRGHAKQVVARVVEVVRRSLMAQEKQVGPVEPAERNMTWDIQTRHPDIQVQGNTLTKTGNYCYAGILGRIALDKKRVSS